MKIELGSDWHECFSCGNRLLTRRCERCENTFCESCAVEKKYCPECWNDKEDGPR